MVSKYINQDGKFAEAAVVSLANDFFKKFGGAQKLVSAEKLYSVGAHIGKPKKFWSPLTKRFVVQDGNRAVFNKTNMLINLQKTLVAINNAYYKIQDTAKDGGIILFVNTKSDISNNFLINRVSRVGASYVNHRWLGGTLTNQTPIKNSINKLANIEMMIKNGELQEKYSKKEQIKIIKQKDKLEKFFGGIKNNYRKPSLVVVFDSLHEKNAIIESKKAGVPVIALCNTDAGNLSDFEFPIPINTGSIKTVSLMISLLTDAIAEIANLPLLVKGVADDKIELPVVTKTKK